MNVESARAYLDQIRFLQAKNPPPGSRTRPKPVRFVVLHSTQGSETLESAEIALQLWHTWDRQSSVHYAVDQNSTVCAMRPEQKAWHAAGGNSDTVGIEHCGRAEQSRAEWLDTFGRGMLAQSGQLVAALLLVFGIPFRRASATDHANANAETSSNGYVGGPWSGGILDHAAITESARLRGIPTGGHWDVGTGFPWDYEFDRIAEHLEEPVTEAEMRKIAGYVAEELRKPSFMGDVDPGPQTVKAACADAVRENLKDQYLRAKP